MDYQKTINNLIEKSENNIKDEIVILNNNKPILNKEDYNIIEGQPIYLELDKYGRSSGAIALISTNTFPLLINKRITYPNPYGWTKKIEEQHIFERCHIIAYNLFAKLTDKRNVFIGTEHLNTSIMFSVENEVRDYIEDNNVRVIYKVTIKYKNKNQIPAGILVEAVSLGDDFSLCKFCYNTENNVIFNYEDGVIIKSSLLNKINQIIHKRTNKTKKPKNNKNMGDNQNQNFAINQKDNKFHLYENNCNLLKNTESKYIIETRCKMKELLDKEIEPCKKCFRNSN